MIITAIDLSKPRKFAQEHINNVLIDLRMKNVDVDKYLKVAKVGLLVSVAIGASLVIPDIAHACGVPLDEAVRNDINKALNIFDENELNKLLEMPINNTVTSNQDGGIQNSTNNATANNPLAKKGALLLTAYILYRKYMRYRMHMHY